jgi:hypothetical protein
VCKVGYGKDSKGSGDCIACETSSCAECASNSATCTRCMWGYSLSSGACELCSTAAFDNCAICGDKSGTAPAECFSCDADYYLNMNATTGADARCVQAAESVKCTGGIILQFACGGASGVFPSILAMAVLVLAAFFRA